MLKCIIWDFDGVILDSLAVRDYGFREIFADFECADVEKLISYHQCNGGLSRFHKIAYFFDEILHTPITRDEVQSYAHAFSQIMRKELTNPKYLIHDSIEFIRRYHKVVDFHIASGSEHNEINFLCHSLGIAEYFKSINGSPTPKTSLVEQILYEAYSPRECILIGDSINDYEAARANGVAFCGYNNTSLQHCSKLYVRSFEETSIDSLRFLE